jgi:hypothetical protein
VTGDIAFIEYFFKNRVNNCSLALKGSESSGFVGSETLLTLLSFVERLAKEYSFQPPVHVWGGGATPEAAAAFHVSGIQNIVFESLHWLTDTFMQTYPSATEKLSLFRVDHSSLVQLSPRLFYRAVNRGNSRAFKNISLRADTTDMAGIQHAADVITSASIYALRSDFSNTQIIPIGIEAAFAGSFCRRFGQETKTAIVNFSREVERLLSQGAWDKPPFYSGRNGLYF